MLDARPVQDKHAVMTEGMPQDPFAAFRQMVNQWEKMANEYGGKLTGSSEFAQGMQGATAVSLQIQQAVNEAMTKVLAASNMPSRADMAALGERIGSMEAQLSRIEAALGAAVGPAQSAASAKPKRTKQPPKSK